MDSTLLGTLDIMPTLLSMAGLSEHIPSSVEGRDLSPILMETGEECKAPDAALYIRNVNGPKDEDGLVRGFFPVARGIKTHGYTFEIAINKDKTLKSVTIFDDRNDPYQLNALDYTKSPEIFATLLEELKAKLKEYNDVWYKEGILETLKF